MNKTINIIVKSFTSITLLSCDVSSSREDYLYCEGKYSEDPAYCSKISNIQQNYGMDLAFEDCNKRSGEYTCCEYISQKNGKISCSCSCAYPEYQNEKKI